MCENLLTARNKLSLKLFLVKFVLNLRISTIYYKNIIFTSHPILLYLLKLFCQFFQNVTKRMLRHASWFQRIKHQEQLLQASAAL